MKPAERDELLGRLDERTRNTWSSVEKIEKHVEKQNGRITKLEITVYSLIAALTGMGILDATVFHLVLGD